MSPIENERFRKLLLAYPAKAVEFLYREYYQTLLATAHFYTRNIKASEDIVQEALILIWEKNVQLSRANEKSIEHYLVRVVKFKSITYYKNTLRQQKSNFDYFVGHKKNIHQPPIDTQIIETESSQEIRNIIQTFPRRERECLLLRIDQEMSTKEIAVFLNISRKAVERSLTCANKRLRKHNVKKK